MSATNSSAASKTRLVRKPALEYARSNCLDAPIQNPWRFTINGSVFVNNTHPDKSYVYDGRRRYDLDHDRISPTYYEDKVWYDSFVVFTDIKDPYKILEVVPLGRDLRGECICGKRIPAERLFAPKLKPMT